MSLPERLVRGRAAVSFLFLFLAVTANAQDPALQQILDRLAEQQKLIESLQATLAEQQTKIDRLEGTRAALDPAKAQPAATSPVPPVIPQTIISRTPNAAPTPEPRRWYEKYALRGYTQVRHNNVVETNPNLICEQCDKSLGGANSFFFRRARFILSGDVTDRIYIYAQPDFASAATNLNFAQLRDLYFDLALNQEKSFRIRAGQSKVPYGFENLQSSQNRLALDRNDGLNSAASNERDLGAFLYWAQPEIRARFAELVSSGLKGSGDYGVFGAGVTNGQTANRPEANNDLHYYARLTYPFKRANGQFIEASIQGYTGRYTVTSDQRGSTTRGVPGFSYTDQRIAASFIYYPQPLGFQTEWNIGRGPEYNPAANTIETRGLHGGYAQTMYMKRFANGHTLTPFYRFQYYNGGKKHEFDARSYLVREHEIGAEWQLNQYLEMVGQYGFSDRTFEDSRLPDNRQKGQNLRIQLQVNY